MRFCFHDVRLCDHMPSRVLPCCPRSPACGQNHMSAGRQSVGSLGLGVEQNPQLDAESVLMGVICEIIISEVQLCNDVSYLGHREHGKIPSKALSLENACQLPRHPWQLAQ